MKYKISRILHSGTQGIVGADRTDEDSLNRIGRIVDLNLENIHIRSATIIRYISDANGNPMRYKALRTSPVREVFESDGDYLVIIKTNNSQYYFEKVIDDERI